MLACRLRFDTTISPFGEHPGDCLILNRRLRAHQDEVVKGLRLELRESSYPSGCDGEKVIFHDHTYFSRELLRDFIATSRRMGVPTVCHLKKGAMTKRTITATMDVEELVGSVGYRLFYYPDGAEIEEVAKPVTIDPDDHVLNMPFPEHMVPGGAYEIPMTTHGLVQIQHWANLWAANQMCVLARAQELRASRRKLLAKVIRAFSTNQWKVCSKNVIVGEGCDIHPTAYLENCVLGDGVEVGAGSVVRLADVGNDAIIANKANLLCSVMGEGSQLRDGVSVQFSVIYPRSFLSCRFMNASFVGREAFIGDGVSLTDFRFDGGTAKVWKDGRRVDTGSYFLGPCIGHNTYLGSGVVVGPGKEIPNNVKVSPVRSRVIGERLEGDFLVIKDLEKVGMEKLVR